AFCACCAAETEGVVEEVPPATAVAVAEPPRAKAKVMEEEPKVPAPAPGVVFTFLTPDNTYKEVTFGAKPLGLDFSKSVPMTVKAVKKDSVAESQAVQPKWVITHVGGNALQSELKEAMAQILQAVKDLPMK
ncbi:unnamed protein product, partial [Symbiodinium microadriaticum]